MGDVRRFGAWARYVSTGRAVIWAVAFLWALLISGTAFAQSYDWGATISEQQVYENPDDHDLNLRYAKQQIQQGEMLNAGAALERMLYANPNWHSARLLYAAVLYRLDDQQAALRELSLLEGKELNTDQTETLERYKEDFQTPLKTVLRQNAPAGTTAAGSYRRPTNRAYGTPDIVKGSLSIGIRADDNAGNALTDEGFGFNNSGDISGVLEGGLQLAVPISDDRSLTARAAINGLIRRHETFSRADYDVIDLRAGLSKKNGGGRLSVDIDARRVNVSGEKYLEQIGPRVTYSQPVSDTTRATVSLSAYSQNYDPLSFAGREDDRDGVKTSLQLGVLKKIKDSQRVNLAVGYETKSAEIGAFAYKGPVAVIGYEKRFTNDVTLKTQLRVRKLNYNDSLSPLVEKRDDTRLAARASVGTSLANLLSSETLDNVVVELGVNYNTRNSNIPANDYDNFGGDLRLTVDF